jgi:hypothetical protein
VYQPGFAAYITLAIMSKILSTFEKNVESLSKMATAFSKLGIFFGGILVVTYSLRIGHFPQDITLADGLLLMTAATCFGLIYIFFLACLISLGMVLSYICLPFAKIFGKIYFCITKKEIEPVHELTPFQWPLAILAVISMLLIQILGERNNDLYYILPVISVLLYLFCSVFASWGNRVNKIENIEGSVIYTHEKEKLSSTAELTKSKINRVIFFFAILTLPLITGQVFGELLDAAMRAAHIRVENSTIYVKEPYSTLLRNALQVVDKDIPDGYTGFTGAKILFNGFGNTLEHFDEYLDEANLAVSEAKTPPSPMAAYNMVLSHWEVFSPRVYPIRVYVSSERKFYNMKWSVDLGVMNTEASAIVERLLALPGFSAKEGPGALMLHLT